MFDEQTIYARSPDEVKTNKSFLKTNDLRLFLKEMEIEQNDKNDDYDNQIKSISQYLQWIML